MDSHHIRAFGIAIALVGSMMLMLAVAPAADDGPCDLVAQSWPRLIWWSSVPLLKGFALLAHGC